MTLSGPLDQIPRRVVLGIVVPCALVVIALLPLWLFQDRLPEPMASNWNWRGQPRGAMPQARLALLIAALCAAPALITGLLAFRRRAGRGEMSGPLAVTSFMAGLFAAMSWLTTWTNLDVDAWRQAGPFRPGLLLLCVLAPFALSACIARLGHALETATSAAARRLPSAGLAPGARAVWVGGANAGSWAMMLGIAVLAMALITPLWMPAVGPLHVIVGLVLLMFTSIRVTVDRNGVRVAYGLLGWPMQRVPLAQIRQATVLHVKPMEWGGWGYRGSLKLMRRAAIVLRTGPGIRLELEGERTLVITVDDAEQAAGVINDLIAANRSAVHS